MFNFAALFHDDFLIINNETEKSGSAQALFCLVCDKAIRTYLDFLTK